MICSKCCMAGDYNAKGHVALAEQCHKECYKCECQHKTGMSWWTKKKPLPPKR